MPAISIVITGHGQPPGSLKCRAKKLFKRQRRMKDHEGIKEAFSTLLSSLQKGGPLLGLERVSLNSRLRTQPSTEKSSATPQACLKGWAGPVHPACIHFWAFRMTTRPVTRRSKPMLSVNLQGSELHDWNGSRMHSMALFHGRV